MRKNSKLLQEYLDTGNREAYCVKRIRNHFIEALFVLVITIVPIVVLHHWVVWMFAILVWTPVLPFDFTQMVFYYNKMKDPDYVEHPISVIIYGGVPIPRDPKTKHALRKSDA